MWISRVGNVIAWAAVIVGLFAHAARDLAPTAASFVIDGPEAICRVARHEIPDRFRLDVFGSVVVVEIRH